MEGFRRICMDCWQGFEQKHPKLSKWVYQITCFFIFSMGVTVFQYLVFTFMPGMLGLGLAGTEFMWPQKELRILGIDVTWSLLGHLSMIFDAKWQNFCVRKIPMPMLV